MLGPASRGRCSRASHLPLSHPCGRSCCISSSRSARRAWPSACVSLSSMNPAMSSSKRSRMSSYRTWLGLGLGSGLGLGLGEGLGLRVRVRVRASPSLTAGERGLGLALLGGVGAGEAAQVGETAAQQGQQRRHSATVLAPRCEDAAQLRHKLQVHCPRVGVRVRVRVG